MKCPRCQAEVHVGQLGRTVRCRNCGNRFEVEVPPPAGAIVGDLGAFLAEVRRLDASLALQLRGDAGGVISLSARGVTVELEAKTDAELVAAPAELEKALRAIGREP